MVEVWLEYMTDTATIPCLLKSYKVIDLSVAKMTSVFKVQCETLSTELQFVEISLEESSSSITDMLYFI